MSFGPASIMATLALLIPLVLFVVLVVWAVRSFTRSRQESVEATAAANAVLIEHLRGISDRLDRIEKQLTDVPL